MFGFDSIDEDSLVIFSVGPLSTIFLLMSVFYFFVADPMEVGDIGLCIPHDSYRLVIGMFIVLSLLSVIVSAFSFFSAGKLSSTLFVVVHTLAATGFSIFFRPDLSGGETTWASIVVIVLLAVYVISFVGKSLDDVTFDGSKDLLMAYSLALTLSMTLMMGCAYADVSGLVSGGPSIHPNGMDLTMVSDIILVCFAGLLASSVLIAYGLKVGTPRISLVFTIAEIAFTIIGGLLYIDCQTLGLEIGDYILISLAIVIPVLNLVDHRDTFSIAKSIRVQQKHDRDDRNDMKKHIKNVKNIERAILEGETALAKLEKKGKLFE